MLRPGNEPDELGNEPDEVVDGPLGDGGGSAGDNGPQGVGKLCGLLDGPFSAKSMQECGGKSVASSDGVDHGGGKARVGCHMLFRKDGTALAPEGDANDRGLVLLGPGPAEFFDQERTLRFQSVQSFRFILIELEDSG